MKTGLIFCETEEISNWYQKQIEGKKNAFKIEYRIESGISSLTDEDLEKFQFIKLSPYYGYEFYSQFTIHNEIDRIIEHCDFSFENKTYCLFYKNLIKEIRKVNPKLDTYGEVLIGCQPLLLKPFVLIATQLGFKKIKIVSNDLNIADTHLKDLQKHIFGTEISVVLQKNLSLLPSSCSLVMCGLDNHQQKDLVIDMSYLNFIKNTGVVVDIFMSQEKSPMTEECVKINIPYIDGLRLESLVLEEILNLTNP